MRCGAETPLPNRLAEMRRNDNQRVIECSKRSFLLPIRTPFMPNVTKVLLDRSPFRFGTFQIDLRRNHFCFRLYF